MAKSGCGPKGEVKLKQAASAPQKLSADARIEKAIGLFRSGHVVESTTLLEAIVKDEPQNGLAWFNLGNAYLVLDEPDAAICAYQEVLRLETSFSGPTHYYLASTYRKMGDHEKAVAEYIKSRDAELQPNLRSQVEADIDDYWLDLMAMGESQYGALEFEWALSYYRWAQRLIAREEVQSLIWQLYFEIQREKPNFTVPELGPHLRNYFLSVNYGYDSNFFRSNTSLPLAAGRFYQLHWGANYRVKSAPDSSVDIGYRMDHEDSAEIRDAFLQDHTLSARQRALSTDYYRVTSLAWTHSLLRGEAQQSMLVASGLFETQLEGYDVGVRGSLSFLQGLASSHYLSGQGLDLRVYAGFWQNHFYLTTFLLGGRKESQDMPIAEGTLPLGYDYWGLGTSAERRWNESLRSYLLVEISQKDFHHSSTFDGAFRRDVAIRSLAELLYLWHKPLEGYVSLEYNKIGSSFNESNVRNKNSEQWRMMVGIACEFVE